VVGSKKHGAGKVIHRPLGSNIEVTHNSDAVRISFIPERRGKELRKNTGTRMSVVWKVNIDHNKGIMPSERDESNDLEPQRLRKQLERVVCSNE
jgi:hypothetical protein